MLPTPNHNLLKQFVDEQIFQIQHRLNTCQTECRSSASSCPSTLIVDIIDKPLKQFVLSHQKHLFYKMNSEIKRFRDQIHEQYLFTSLNYPSFNPQKVTIYYLCLVILETFRLLFLIATTIQSYSKYSSKAIRTLQRIKTIRTTYFMSILTKSLQPN